MNKILKDHYAKISRMGAAAIAKKFKLKTKAQKKAYYSAVRAGKKMSEPIYGQLGTPIIPIKNETKTFTGLKGICG